MAEFDSRGDNRREKAVFVQRVLAVVVIVVSVALVLYVLARLSQVLLLTFAGILGAVFLRSLANPLRDKTQMSDGLALSIVVFVLLLLCGGGGWIVAPSVAEQTTQLSEALPVAYQDLRQDLQGYEWGSRLFEYIDAAEPMPTEPGEVIGQARVVATTVLGGLVGFLVVIFIGLYLAAKPNIYREGIIRLIPIERRPRAREVVDECVVTLKRWLLGRIALMVLVGLMTGIGLWILGIPLALVLGVLAALLEFIPNVGPLLAMIPALLIAWTISPTTALYVAILYFAIQQLESFVLTPLVMRKTVKLPPVLTILALFGFGFLFGPLGVVLATPITAVGLVLVKKLYVEDALGEHKADRIFEAPQAQEG
jgi:predicted PurR-regulated permease PerM